MSRPKGLWLGVAALAACAVLLLGPVLGAPTTRVLGNFQTEAATHAPALAAALEGLWTHGPFLLAEHPLHPNEVNGAMYEPITTLVMWPVYALAGGGTRGFTLAWNTWNLVILVVTGIGAWIWARAWLGEERDPGGWGAGVAMALASASMFVHLGPEVGRTEAQNYPLYALHAGLLFHAVRRSNEAATGRATIGAWIPAALSVVPVVWSGGYGSVFFALAEAGLAAWALATTPERKRVLGGLLLTALVAGLAVSPLLWALQAHPYVGIAGRDERHTVPSVALSVLFVGSESPLRELPGYEIAPFAGVVTLLAAVLAPARVRSAAWPLTIGLFLYWVAAGPAPTIGDSTVWGPAAVLSQLPGPAGVLRGWSRIFGFAVPFFAVAAGALVGGRRALAIGVAALAVGETARVRLGQIRGEGAVFNATSWWSLEEPASIVALRAAGEVPIALPIDGIERTRRWLADPVGPDVWRVMPDHELFRYFQDALPNEPELFRNRFGAPQQTYEPCSLLEDAVSLRILGFTALALREESLPRDGRGIASRALKAVFGAPKEDGLWRLPEVVPPECEGEEAPAAIVLHGEEGAENGRPRTPAERAAIREARREERERVRRERVKMREERERR